MSYFDEMMDNQLDLSKVRDRGSKKWVAMMLPEHVALLRQYNEDSKKVPRPQLDEWDYEALHTSLHNALISKADTRIKLWKDGEIVYKRGTIESVDLKRRRSKWEILSSLKQMSF